MGAAITSHHEPEIYPPIVLEARGLNQGQQSRGGSFLPPPAAGGPRLVAAPF